MIEELQVQPTWQNIYTQETNRADFSYTLEIRLSSRGVSLPGSPKRAWNHKTCEMVPLPEEEQLKHDGWTTIHNHAAKLAKEVEGLLTREVPGALLQAANDRVEFQRLFPDAPMDKMPNGYCGEPCCTHIPWYRFGTVYGPVTIGWRKRVIHIDWSGFTFWKPNGRELFPDTTSSVGEAYIHAWSLEEAKSYVDRLLRGPE